MWERYRERDKKRVLYRVELKNRVGGGKERRKSGERAVFEVNMYRKWAGMYRKQQKTEENRTE